LITDETVVGGVSSRLIDGTARRVSAIEKKTPQQPELVVAEGLRTLPPSLSGLEQLLSENRYLVLFDRELSDEELELKVLRKYNLLSIPDRLVTKGLADVARIDRKVLAGLTKSFDLDFDGRVALVTKKESRDLRQAAGRLHYPHQVIYTKRSPNDLITPLSFSIISNDGKLTLQDRTYIDERPDHVFRIRAIDELILRILVRHHADALMATAA
jgi:hypothetical protein